jgi:hypothetical protein
MDFVTLKKKLSTYVSAKGYLTNVSDDVLYEVLVAWENWTGSSKEFYRSLGFSQTQMAGIIGKAKKLKREGHFGTSEFKQLAVEGESASPVTSHVSPCTGAEIVWTNGRVIRFSEVDMLVDFLKKSA